MNKITISLMMLLIIATGGCSRREPPARYLSYNALLKLDVSKVNEITMHCVSRGAMPYSYYFSIDNPEKINVILRCMREATQIVDKQRTHKRKRLFIFKTHKVIYQTGIGWDNEVVYGDWEDEKADYHGRWESAELLEKFKEWNLFEEIVAADPNLPPPKWITNPPKFEDTMPPMPIILGKNNIYLSEEVFSTLNPSKIAKIMIITISGVAPADLKKNIFSITDTETIENIMRIIATAARNPPTFRGSNIVFEIEDTFYYTGITWDDKTVFGDWWESEKLFTLFSSLIPLSEQE